MKGFREMTLLPVTSNRKKNSQERVRHERTGFPETGLKFKHQVTSVILSTQRERTGFSFFQVAHNKTYVFV